MPTVPPPATEPARPGPHRARELAESFGEDPERYDRTRPRYPVALTERIVGTSPGPAVLDVGIGTGVSAAPFVAAGCRVLGVEVDARMAAFARTRGYTVEVAPFERWDAAGRSFDAVIAGQTWHWIDPVAGASAAARVLRPDGLLAAFWNVQRPPAQLARAFAAVYERVLPGSPFAGGQRDSLRGYEPILAATCDGIRAAGGFAEPERWREDWTQAYTTAEWLELVPTFGGHGRLDPAQLDALLAGLADAVDALGGRFTMGYATVAIVARRARGAT